MILTPEQQAILDGARGEVLAKVMKTLVMYGQTFGADRMVPVTSEYNHHFLWLKDDGPGVRPDEYLY